MVGHGVTATVVREMAPTITAMIRSAFGVSTLSIDGVDRLALQPVGKDLGRWFEGEALIDPRLDVRGVRIDCFICNGDGAVVVQNRRCATWHAVWAQKRGVATPCDTGLP